jgi:hypothetical protein
MLQVLNLHIPVLSPRLSLNKYDSSIFFLSVNRILHQMHYHIIIFLTTVIERFQDQFIQKWFSDIDNASGGEFYSHLKKIYSNHTY